MRKRPRPVLIEFKTFRMRGHEEASGTDYVPDKTLKFWEQKDPIKNFEDFLLKEGILSEDWITQQKSKISLEIDQALKKVNSEESVVFNESKELIDVYHPYDFKAIEKMSEAKSFGLLMLLLKVCINL